MCPDEELIVFCKIAGGGTSLWSPTFIERPPQFDQLLPRIFECFPSLLQFLGKTNASFVVAFFVFGASRSRGVSAEFAVFFATYDAAKTTTGR